MVAAAVGAVGSIGGALISSSGAQSAANTQAQEAGDAASMQWNEFNTVLQNELPYMNLGSSAITPLLQAMGYTATKNPDGTYSMTVNPNSPLQKQFTAPTLDQVRGTPGYQFQMQQGQQAINNSAAARGGLLSGATLKDLLSYGQGLADSTYQQVFNNDLSTFNTNYSSAANNVSRLTGLTTLGQNAATMVGNQGLQTAANAGNLLTSGANATAAGQVASGNAISGALGSLGGAAQTYGLLNQLTGQGQSSYSGAAGWSPSGGVSSAEASLLNPQ